MGSVPFSTFDFIWKPVAKRLQYEAAKAVVADAAHPADFQTQARQAGGDVQLGAGDTFHEMLHLGQIPGFGGDKHGHSFADGDDI